MRDHRDEWDRAVEPSDGAPGYSIAIVGAACNYPGNCPDLDAFWRLLSEAGCGIGEVPEQRWPASDYAWPRRAGFLPSYFPKDFDAAFFGVSPAEARGLDPQQRLLLETGWRALESAGIPVDQEGSPIGVFVAISTTDFQQLHFSRFADSQYAATGASFATAAGRLSYCFGFTGPSLAVDTACSSSLVAFHLACQAIRSGECEAALVAGVNALLTPNLFASLSALNLLSREGHCSPFGADANGYVRAEGCGALVLKPLDKALQDGNEILAVCRGSAVNHDGRTNGLTAPNGTAQVRVINQALERAGVPASTIDYVEAHGTGTPLGDSVEINALAKAYAAGRDDQRPLLVGSVKANLGHLEAGAGMAGLIKTILSVKRGVIPAQARAAETSEPFQLAPHIEWDKVALRVPSTQTVWPASGHLRRAGVSSFGFGGTNAHVIIEQFDESKQVRSSNAAPSGPVILPISARTPDALADLSIALADWLDADPRNLHDVAFTLAAGRTVFPYRRAVAGDTASELAGLLRGGTAAGSDDDPVLRRLVELAELWMSGGDVDFSRLARAAGGKIIALPGHPFRRETYWLGDKPRSTPDASAPDCSTLASSTPATSMPISIEEWSEVIGAQARIILGGKTGSVLDFELPLADQGFTSLLGLELRHYLEKLSARSLPTTFFYNYPSIRRMALFFSEADRPIAAAEGRDKGPRTSTDADFDFLDTLSAEELAAFIDREMDLL